MDKKDNRPMVIELLGTTWGITKDEFNFIVDIWNRLTGDKLKHK